MGILEGLRKCQELLLQLVGWKVLPLTASCSVAQMFLVCLSCSWKEEDTEFILVLTGGHLDLMGARHFLLALVAHGVCEGVVCFSPALTDNNTIHSIQVGGSFINTSS